MYKYTHLEGDSNLIPRAISCSTRPIFTTCARRYTIRSGSNTLTNDLTPITLLNPKILFAGSSLRKTLEDTLRDTLRNFLLDVITGLANKQKNRRSKDKALFVFVFEIGSRK